MLPNKELIFSIIVGGKRPEQDRLSIIILTGAAAFQLGNTSCRTITEVKQC